MLVSNQNKLSNVRVNMFHAMRNEIDEKMLMMVWTERLYFIMMMMVDVKRGVKDSSRSCSREDER